MGVVGLGFVVFDVVVRAGRFGGLGFEVVADVVVVGVFSVRQQSITSSVPVILLKKNTSMISYIIRVL